MKPKIIFLVLTLIISSCSSGNEDTIDELEEQIVALENKEDLTPEEEEELEELIEEQEELIEEEEIEEFENDDECSELFNERLNCAIEKDKNDPKFSKYYTVGEPDPAYNPGKFLPRHCLYSGEYNGEYYEEVPLLDVPLKDEYKLDYYEQSTGVYEDGLFPLNIEDYKGEYGYSLGQIDCIPDWAFAHGIGGDGIVVGDEPEPSLQKNFYGLSFYTRISEFYSTRPEGQQGLWGQWIQAPGSHPYGPAGGTIEGGYGVYDKFGRSKYPIYMASGANLFYNASSTFSGWGFYEVRCACSDFGGVQLTNKVLNLPNAIHFDEDQNEYAEDGGIYFGHGWFALPIFGGEERPDSYFLDEPTTDAGKLTWTFVANSAQYSGPMWAYVPEFWYRNLDVFNSFELLIDSAEEDGIDYIGKEVRENLIEYIAGRLDNETLMESVKSLGWYVDSADDYDYESESGLFWVEEKNTLAYRSTNYAAMGSEMYELPVFTEYDESGDLYIKIFPPSLPSLKEKEYLTLDARSYDIGVYNNFVDFFNGDADIKDIDTSFSNFSTPMFVEEHERNSPKGLKPMDLYMVENESDIELGEEGQLVSWNLYLKGETRNGETNTFWDWGGTTASERELSEYYKVVMPGGVKDYLSYKFTPVNESQVPETLKLLEMKTLERANSYMPHIKSNSDKVFEEEVKNNIDMAFGVDSNPYDYSCFDCDNGGCDTTVYETTLDDGSMIKYRWYRFRDQPTFKYLSIDYPEIYTEEYLDLLQSKIEKMHKEWGNSEDFIATPKTLNNFHLVELDNGMVIEPPTGKEYGWVPIVIEVEIPYGKYVTRVNDGDLTCGVNPGDPPCSTDDISGEEGLLRIGGRVSPP